MKKHGAADKHTNLDTELDHAALIQKAKLLSEAEQIAGFGSYVLDLPSGTWRSSDALDRLMGIDAGYQRTVQGWSELIHPDDRAEMVAYFSDQVLGQRQTFNKTYRIVQRGTGVVLVVHGLGRLECDADDALVRMYGTIRDITTQQHMADTIQEKSADLDHFFNGSLDLLCIADTDGYFRRLNPQWHKTLGYTLTALEHHRFLDFVHPDDLDATLEAVQNLANQAEVASFVNRYRCHDGSYRWIEWNSKPAGNLIYATARDITARKAAEDRIQALLEEKELILQEVHHRIKNNMSTVHGLLVLQAETLTNPAAIASLLDASCRVQSMMVLYDRLYQSSGFHAMRLREYLPALAQEILVNFPKAGHVQLVCAIADVELDAKRLQALGIIVNELLTNSMKYSFDGRAEGTITLGATMDGKNLVLSVGDNGCGFPESITFENTTGFGLKLLKHLAQQLRGTIRIERTRGTRFILEFAI